MTWPLNYYIEVESDLVYAKKWYKDQQPGLNLRFSAEVRKSIKKLQKQPFHYKLDTGTFGSPI